MNGLLSILGALVLGSKKSVNEDMLFCLMETNLHQRSKGSFANTIDLHNMCSHFAIDSSIHRACEEYAEDPLMITDRSRCAEFINVDEVADEALFHKWAHFTDFMMEHNKIYADNAEILSRFHIFQDNMEWVAQHNLIKENTYKVGATRFADMTHSEYKEYVKSGGLSVRQENLHEVALRGGIVSDASLGLPKDMCGTMKSESGTFPTTVDWRTKGVVTPVRDQGQQGTCYAHAASENLESVYALKKGTLPSLSVQQIVDCSYSYGNHGNNGGMYTYAWTYVHDAGLTTEAAYPYTAGDSDRSSCKPFTPYTYTTSCNHVPANELQLTYAVSHQPVSVAIEADSRSFQLYTSGVYNDPACGTDIDHAVVAVGYNSMNGQDYWIVRNSWGSDWGQGGYIYIARNSVATSTVGQCAIATYAAYPIL